MSQDSFISYGKQSIDEEDIQAVVDVLRSDYLTQGPIVEEFERAIADYVGAKYAVAFSNGTAALHGAYYAAGIREGDEVITTPITFAATANAVLYCGGTPVFADIHPKTYNLDPKEAEKKITSRTKAIAPVDFTGQPCDIDAFMELAEKYNLVIIEDGAHSLGAEYKGKKVGSQAHMTMFSFHPVKPITTGEGGIITTNSEEYFEKLKLFRSHGIMKTDYAKEQGDWYYEMVDLGYNYRMNDIQAALGLSQLKKLDTFLEKRRAIADYYNEQLKNISGIITPYQDTNTNSGWHLYMIQLDQTIIQKTRKEVFEAMRAAKIGVHVHYIPVYKFPYYKTILKGSEECVNAEEWYIQALTLPLHPSLEKNQYEKVLNSIKRQVVKEFNQ